MRRSRLALLVPVVLGLAMPAGAGWAASEPFHFVAFGDMPYVTPADYARMANVVEAINATRPAFAIHVGDLKGGGRSCDDATFTRVKPYFDAVTPALVYTPGDNDWADCDRLVAGGYDTRERLAFLRKMFFASSQSLGTSPIEVVRQKDVMPEIGLPENLIWQHNDVLFATVHVVGSDDNLSDDRDEFMARRAANLAWIGEIFRRARESAIPGVVVSYHADMFRPFASPAAFGGIRAALADAAESFGHPVLLIHGDGHTFTVDRPLALPGAETVLANVTRVEVFGDDRMHAVRIDVDPASADVFTVSPLYVEANR